MTGSKGLLLVVASLAFTSTSTPSNAQQSYRYLHLDVFTDHALSGNQLAVFMEPAGLSPETMLAITREMNFSETTFVFPSERDDTHRRVRIFGNNLSRELLVAGHPTVGTVFALAHEGWIEPGSEEVVLGLGIGPTRLELEWEDEALAFAWMQQRGPEFGGVLTERGGVAEALGVAVSDLLSGLPVQQVSCGAPFLIVPLASRDAVDRSRLDRARMGELLDRFDLVAVGSWSSRPTPAERMRPSTRGCSVSAWRKIRPLETPVVHSAPISFATASSLRMRRSGS